MPDPADEPPARGQYGKGRHGMACYAAAVRILEVVGRDLRDNQRRALEILAGSPHGCTEAILRAHRFGVVLLAGLLRAGFAKAEAETTRDGGRVISVVRIRITDAGKRALAG